MSRRRVLVRGVPALLYAACVAWTTGFSGPLGAAETSTYLAKLEAQGLPVESGDRTRRTLLEIVTIPETRGRHELEVSTLAGPSPVRSRPSSTSVIPGCCLDSCY